MTEIGQSVHLLRNISVEKLIKALERDGFLLKRSTRTGSHIYKHPDGRITLIHYHHKKDTLTRKTLTTFLEGTSWNKDDLHRLKLIK